VSWSASSSCVRQTVSKVAYGFDVGRAADSFGSRLEPVADGFLTKVGARTVVSDKFGLFVGNRGELIFDDTDDARMQRHPL
jgi:hypothetical protein